MRARSSVVIIEKGKVALIKRIWKGTTYYVFPGGGVEKGEDLKSAAKREALEELGLYVNVNNCISKVEFEGNPQYFFLSEITSGTFGTGQAEEYTKGNRGIYKPVWLEIQALLSMDVRPLEVASKVQSLFMSTKS